MPDHDPDLSRIRPLNGDRRIGFEEFCAQLARHDNAPAGSRFVRLEGAGGDGGVECYWVLADGTEWGYQSKFLDHLDKAQVTASVETAIRIHPHLTRYVVCLPFDLSGRTGRRGSDQETRWTGYVAEWQQLAADRGLTVSFEKWPRSELIERLVRIDPTGGRRRFWFHQEILSAEWFADHIADATSDAGPRYHPELNVKVPISSQLGAFGETPAWKASYSRWLRNFAEEISRWRRATVDRDNGVGKERMEAAAPLLEAAHSTLRSCLTADRVQQMIGEHSLARAMLLAVRRLHLVVEHATVQVTRRPLVIAQRRHREAGVVEGLASSLQLQPPLAEIDPVHHVVTLEWVIEVAAARRPIDELDRHLVGRVAGRHPLALVEVEPIEEELDRAEGRLADAGPSLQIAPRKMSGDAAEYPGVVSATFFKNVAGVTGLQAVRQPAVAGGPVNLTLHATEGIVLEV